MLVALYSCSLQSNSPRLELQCPNPDLRWKLLPYGSMRLRCLSRGDVPTQLTTQQNLGVYPPACVVLKPRQLFFDFPKAPPLIHPGSRGDAGDQLRPCKAQAEEVTQTNNHRSLCFLGVCCCRITHGQVRTWPWLSCWGTAKGHPEQEENSSTSPLQSLPEGSSQNRQPGSSCGQRDGEPRLERWEKFWR